MIHKTFSKRDLIDIMNDYNITIPNYEVYNKTQLSILLNTYITNETHIDFENNIVYKPSTLQELKDFLKNKNPDKPLNIREKNKVMRFCKEVIHLCKNGYVLQHSSFQSYEEINIQMRDICKYGDIPSVRRCCKLYNLCHSINERFTPIISLSMQKKLNDKEKMKHPKYAGLVVSKGKYIIRLD